MLLDLIQSLEKEALAKSDLIALEHVRKKPEGRGFFAVAELLVRMKRVEEAIQILEEGLARHPHYSVARVYLAQLLFQQKLFPDSWHALESSPASLKSNLSGQILSLKLAVLLGLENQARNLARELSGKDYIDPETKVIIQHIEKKTFQHLRRDYADHLHWDGLKAVESLVSAVHEETRQVEAMGEESMVTDLEFRNRVAKGFFACPIQEIFLKYPQDAMPDGARLDDLTKARLFRRQGLYQKSFDIYERLVYSSPGNELLRREFAEIRNLRDTQNLVDKQLDPELVTAMESVRHIDRRIRVLNQLLGRIDEYEAAS